MRFVIYCFWLTIKFLILHDKNVNNSDIGYVFHFSKYLYFLTIIEDIDIYFDDNYSIHYDYKGYRFDVDREGFIDIVRIIPYMLS